MVTQDPDTVYRTDVDSALADSPEQRQAIELLYNIDQYFSENHIRSPSTSWRMNIIEPADSGNE